MSKHVVIPLTMLCLFPLSVSAQRITNEFRLNTHAIRRIAWNVMNEEKEAKILTSWNELNDPADTVVILLGKQYDNPRWPYLSNFPQEWSWFVRRGGALLVATDDRFETFARITGYRVTGGRVMGSSRFGRRAWNHGRLSRDALYRGQNDCPVITSPKIPPDPFFLEPNVRENKLLLRLVTNRPSYLEQVFRVPERRVKMLPSFPAACYYDGRGYLTWPFSMPFGLTCDYGDGRIMLLSDHSIFINEMLLQEDRPNDDSDDIGNITFAYNVLQWLRGPTRRHKILFVVDGEIQTELNIPLIKEPLKLDQLEQMVMEGGNRVFEGLNKREASTNRAIIRGLGRGPGRAIFGRRSSTRNFYLLLILGLTLALGVVTFLRLRKGTHRLEPGVPLLATTLERNKPEQMVLLYRQEQLFKEDNLAAQARTLARSLFASAPGRSSPDQRPTVKIEGPEKTAKKLQKEVTHLWNLAYGAEMPRVTVRHFRRLLEQLQNLERQLRAGQLQMEWT